MAPTRSDAVPLASERADRDVSPRVEPGQPVVDDNDHRERIGLQDTLDRGLYTQPPANTDAGVNVDRPSVDEIDWEISADLNWDEIVTGADQGFTGMSFDEARKNGLVDDLETD
jgi:hypothetical protein